MNNITNTNSKGQYHGYQERYWSDKLGYRTNYKNDKFIGYHEIHFNKITRYYIR